MNQTHNFIVESRKRLDNLNTLIAELLPEFGISFDGAGGRSGGQRRLNNMPVSPVDAADYDLIQNSRSVGKYSFLLEDTKYIVFLDLSGVNSTDYESLVQIITRKFPEFSPSYTR